MRGDGRNGKKEWLVGRGEGFFEEAKGLAGDEIGGILPGMVYGGIVIALKRGVPIVVCIWVQKEVGTAPAFQMGVAVVPDGVCVEHLARIEGAIPGVLQPHWKIILIVAIFHEDGEAAYKPMCEISVSDTQSCMVAAEHGR